MVVTFPNSSVVFSSTLVRSRNQSRNSAGMPVELPRAAWPARTASPVMAPPHVAQSIPALFSRVMLTSAMSPLRKTCLGWMSSFWMMASMFRAVASSATKIRLFVPGSATTELGRDPFWSGWSFAAVERMVLSFSAITLASLFFRATTWYCPARAGMSSSRMIFCASAKTRFSPRSTILRDASSGTARRPAKGELGSLAIAVSWLARADGVAFLISTVLLFFRLSGASSALMTLRAFWTAVALPMRRTLAPLAMGATPTSPFMAALSPSATKGAET